MGQYVGFVRDSDSVSLCRIICGVEYTSAPVISVRKSEVRTNVTCNAEFIAVNFSSLIKEQSKKWRCENLYRLSPDLCAITPVSPYKKCSLS